jgi:hypothetical protein
MHERELHIFGGATEESTGDNPWSGNIARTIAEKALVELPSLAIKLHLTEEAGGTDGLRTDKDLAEAAREVTADYATRMVMWMPDSPRQKQIAETFRRQQIGDAKPRKDIFLAGMSATRGATGVEQYGQGLALVKESSANLALAYDYDTANGMVVAPEETTYDESTNLDAVIDGLIDISQLRSQLNFTESTVVGGEPVAWNSSLIYPSLREVVDYCVQNDAYKPFLGVTAGHFAAKLSNNEFLTSRRKTDFRELGKVGLVRVVTDGPDRVLAYGAKPSVGGQSQRIVFAEHPERDLIVHFHCPIKPGSNVPVVSQREYECGSHECGKNTSDGLMVVDDGIEAVYLDNHGPNVVFHHDEDPRKVQEFISDNFDLSKKTGGYQLR